MTSISMQAASTHQGPNLQNFVKCTYETVTRELRIVSQTFRNSLV